MASGAEGFSRTERKRAERIARLERIAARAFAEYGYNGTNFDLVAAEIDLRGASLYNYVSSKEELFLRCINNSAYAVFDRVQRIADSDLSPIDKLRALIHEQILIVVRDLREFVPLFFKTEVPVQSLKDRILEVRRSHAAIYERVAEQIRRGTGVNRMTVRIWLEIVYGAISYLPDWYDPNGPLGCEQLADTLADTLVDPFRRIAGTGPSR